MKGEFGRIKNVERFFGEIFGAQLNPDDFLIDGDYYRSTVL
jgi:hypothetical protein